jgi:DNA-binding response OmpR family regulator
MLSFNNKEVFLKNKEFELVKYLMNNQGKILSRINILENVWDMNANVMTNTVDVHVSRVRYLFKKHFELEDIIKTVQCIGYMMG